MCSQIGGTQEDNQIMHAKHGKMPQYSNTPVLHYPNVTHLIVIKNISKLCLHSTSQHFNLVLKSSESS